MVQGCAWHLTDMVLPSYMTLMAWRKPIGIKFEQSWLSTLDDARLQSRSDWFRTQFPRESIPWNHLWASYDSLVIPYDRRFIPAAFYEDNCIQTCRSLIQANQPEFGPMSNLFIFLENIKICVCSHGKNTFWGVIF